MTKPPARPEMGSEDGSAARGCCRLFGYLLSELADGIRMRKLADDLVTWRRGRLAAARIHVWWRDTEVNMARASWNGVTIAESDECEVVEGNLYFPRASLKEEHFTASDTTSVCGWKGTANYFHVVVDGQRNADAAWFYPAPKQAAENIRGHVAFWRGVTVTR